MELGVTDPYKNVIYDLDYWIHIQHYESIDPIGINIFLFGFSRLAIPFLRTRDAALRMAVPSQTSDSFPRPALDFHWSAPSLPTPGSLSRRDAASLSIA